MSDFQLETSDALSVSELTEGIKNNLESNFRSIRVQGEISNLRPAASGHIYFTLKDQKASLSCALFKGRAMRMKKLPKEGDEILCRGSISVYPPRGSYQLIVDQIEPRGQGALMVQFEKLKEKLLQEGLFDEKRKKPIPVLPKKVVVITSPTGAAIRDILHVIGRRNPFVDLLIVPSLVQGDQAEKQLVSALQKVIKYKLGDVIVLARGGGSIEDLWCFNSEKLARVIASSDIPIISAVGHEVDFTISDFVSDLRAPTPSAAAEVVVSSRLELLNHMNHLNKRLVAWMSAKLELYRSRLGSSSPQRMRSYLNIDQYRLRLDDLVGQLEYNLEDLLKTYKHKLQLAYQVLMERSPRRILDLLRTRLHTNRNNLVKSMEHLIKRKSTELKNLAGLLNSLSPLQVFERGYSLVFNEKNAVVSSIKSVSPGDKILVRVKDGKFSSTVD
jgi:exodeoxyribonuclease VII large subunit